MTKLLTKSSQELHHKRRVSVSDKAAQQTILSVFTSILGKHKKSCNSVSEQLIAAGASEEEEVKKVSQNIAHTVRLLEVKSSLAEPSPEARSLPCEEMSSNDEFSAGENIPGFSSMDIERQESIKSGSANGQTEGRRLARKF